MMSLKGSQVTTEQQLLLIIQKKNKLNGKISLREKKSVIIDFN